MAWNMQQSFYETELITTVYLVGFNCNRCITIYGINNVKSTILSTLTICIISYASQVCTKPRCLIIWGTNFVCGTQYSCVFSMELASCNPSGALNFEMASRLLQNVCTPHTLFLSSTRWLQQLYQYRKSATMVTLCCNSCGVQNNNNRYALYGLLHVKARVGRDFQFSEMFHTCQTSYLILKFLSRNGIYWGLTIS
jgi:hypothetical protein